MRLENSEAEAKTEARECQAKTRLRPRNSCEMEAKHYEASVV